jgi:hypothetical protein
MREPGHSGGDRLKEAMAHCAAQLERTEASRRRLEARLLGVDPDEEEDDALEELWAVDLDATLDAYLDQRKPS